jgi:hypothetical protein
MEVNHIIVNCVVNKVIKIGPIQNASLPIGRRNEKIKTKGIKNRI